MTFGDKLALLRKHHDMSQEAFAEKMKTSRATVSRWEAGQTVPDMLQIMTISEIFSVSVDYLVNDKNNYMELGHISDFHTMRMLFWVCTAILMAGFVISMFGWQYLPLPFPVMLGLIMSIIGCVFFEVYQPRGIDRTMVKYARRRFYAANTWVLLPTPLYITVTVLSSQFDCTSLLHLIASVLYLVIASVLTICLICQYRG